MENEFPPNSNHPKEERPSRPEKTEKKTVARVTKGKVIQRKKPLRKKFIDAFRPEDNVGFVEYTVLEVLVPGIKDALADAVHGTIDNALGTSSAGRSRRRSGSGGYTSYSGMSSSRPRSRRDRDDDRRPARRETRMADDAREIVLDSRVEAEEVLDNMIELISKYDVATMRDLLSLVGEPHNPTHEDWGWDDLRGARIHRIREGYLIDLPRPVALD
jgi:hypothetical protein